jgi:hypothetical protein
VGGCLVVDIRPVEDRDDDPRVEDRQSHSRLSSSSPPAG